MEPNTRAALSLCHTIDHPAFDPLMCTCHVYVDGSSKAGRAAWAAFVVWQDFDGKAAYVQGLFGAELCCDPNVAGFIGETQCESIHAEQTGVIYALLWLLQNATTCSWQCQFVILFGSLAAGCGAGGTMALPDNSCLSVIARGVAQAVASCFIVPVECRPVKGHAGPVWNSLAAKVLAGVLPPADSPIPCPPDDVARNVRLVGWKWAWLPLLPDSASAYPHFASGYASWQPTFSPADPDRWSLLPLVCHRAGSDKECASVSFRAFTLSEPRLGSKLVRIAGSDGYAGGSNLHLLGNPNSCAPMRVRRTRKPNKLLRFAKAVIALCLLQEKKCASVQDSLLLNEAMLALEALDVDGPPSRLLPQIFVDFHALSVCTTAASRT